MMLDVLTPQMPGDLGARNPEFLLTAIGNRCSRFAHKIPSASPLQLLLTHLSLSTFFLDYIFYAPTPPSEFHLPQLSFLHLLKYLIYKLPAPQYALIRRLLFPFAPQSMNLRSRAYGAGDIFHTLQGGGRIDTYFNFL